MPRTILFTLCLLIALILFATFLISEKVNEVPYTPLPKIEAPQIPAPTINPVIDGKG